MKPCEWWERLPKHAVRRVPPPPPSAFEFDILEHLPSSPLCPASPMFTGVGAPMCVYHGRRRLRSGRGAAAEDLDELE